MRHPLAPVMFAAFASAHTYSSHHKHHSHNHTSALKSTAVNTTVLGSAASDCTPAVVTNTLTQTITTTLFSQIAAANATSVEDDSCPASEPATVIPTSSVAILSAPASKIVSATAVSVPISSTPALKVQSTTAASVPILSASASTVLAGTTAPTGAAFERASGIGKLPALGWNSWSAYRGHINATIIEKTAELFISLGLKDAGYEYVNMDDYWGDYGGRDKNGQLRADASRFPDGIAAVVDKIHSLGLKAGIYSSASVSTCGGYPASLNHEEIDAATFASWGIDYLKYDNCQVPAKHPGVEVVDEYVFCTPQSDADRFNGAPVVNGSCAITSKTAPPGYDWKLSNTYHRYEAMSKAILAQEHEILFSLCDWGWADVRSWGASIANSYRVSSDIQDPWGTIMGTFNQGIFMSHSCDFWGHNDLDILQVGNGNLSPAESRTHFAMWAALKSPILIGTDLGSLSAENLAIVKNKYLLAFHQDAVYGKPAVPFNWDWSWDRTKPTAHYWSGSSVAGTLVLLFNPDDNTETLTANWADVPGLSAGSYETTDIWTGETSCVANALTRTVISHDTAGVIVGNKC